jgi:pimeloyl-ACP methyl ester carboxylesterase
LTNQPTATTSKIKPSIPDRRTKGRAVRPGPPNQERDRLEVEQDQDHVEWLDQDPLFKKIFSCQGERGCDPRRCDCPPVSLRFERLVGRRRRNAWWFRSKVLRPDSFTNQEIEAYCHEYSKPNRLTQGWAYYRAIPSTAKINRQFATKPLTMPVLAIGGSYSAGLNLARAIAQSTPEVLGEVIGESGHFVPEEQPERTLAVLLGALSTANL